MAYDKEKIYNQILELIDKEDLHTIEECCSYVGISKQTFYRFFEIDSDECDAIKNKLQIRKTKNVHSVIRNWATSDNATLQIAYVKINSEDDTRKRLSNTYIDKTDVSVNGETNTFTITRKIISDSNDSTE